MKLSVAILISGSGSNMVQLIKSMDDNHPAFPSIVISNKPNAAGIKKAQDLGIPTQILKENFEKSPWSDRLTLHHCRIQDFSSEEYFDLIISNPPFFENSKHSGDSAKDLARHTDQLAFTELIFAANNLMKEKGTFSVIIPAKQSEKFARLSQAQGLFCNKICWVKPTESKEPIRAMMNFNKFKTNREEEELIIEENGRHNYSSDYIRLTGDFYLNF